MSFVDRVCQRLKMFGLFQGIIFVRLLLANSGKFDNTLFQYHSVVCHDVSLCEFTLSYVC